MAKIITGYYAVVAVDSYFRPEPVWSTSGATKVSAGHTFVIYAREGAPWMEGEFYRSGAGYIYSGDVTITDTQYETTTDACSPPWSVSLSDKTLTITGGAGGDLNAFTGYGISWRDKPIGGSYGGWSGDVVVNSSNNTVTYAVDAPVGMVREFRARTLGSAGEGYYSGYTVCPTTLTGNTAPYAPSIQIPAGGAHTYSNTPVIGLYVYADADGDAMDLYRNVDNGGWVVVSGLMKGGMYYDKLPSLGSGSHTIRYMVADGYTFSGETSVSFTVLGHSWSRPINAGDIIANASISHVADINEMLAAVNVQRSFYGLPQIELRGTVGRFGDWKAQMEKLQAGIVETGKSVNKTISFGTVPSYPTASIINAIRTQLKAF